MCESERVTMDDLSKAVIKQKRDPNPSDLGS